MPSARTRRRAPTIDLDDTLPDDETPLSAEELDILKRTAKRPGRLKPKSLGHEVIDDASLRQLLEDRLIDEPKGATFSHRAVQRMAQVGVPDAEIARVLGIDVKHLTAEAEEALNLGRTLGKVQLRLRQYAAAMSGDRTLLVWLGKQSLGQMDRMAQEVSGPGGGPVEHQHAVLSVRAKLEAMLRAPDTTEILDAVVEPLPLPHGDAPEQATD